MSGRNASWLAAIVVAVSVAGSALTAALPTIGLQVAVVVGGASALAALLIARLDRVLNAAWIVVIALYLIGPLGSIVRGVGLGVPTIAALAVGPIPFVVAALYLRPGAGDRLRLMAPLALLVALAAVSLAWSTNPAYGAEKLVVWLVTGILPAAFIIVLASASPRVMWSAIAAVAFASAVTLLVFGETSPVYPGRLSLYGDNPIWTARAAFIGALVALFGPFPRIARLIMVPVLVLAGIVTVSLGPLLGFAVGVWAGTAEMLRSADRRTDRLGLGWVALGLVSGLGLVVLLADAFFGGDASILARVLVNDPNVSGRATFLDAAVRLFSTSPFLGVGIGGFASSGLIEYPHNLVAEIGSELGGVGLIVLAIWLAIALRGAARSPVLVALLAGTAVYALFSGSVATNGEFWMVSALCAANIAVGARAKAPIEDVPPAAARRRSVVVARGAPARRS